jgi:uncharacterized protein
VNELVLDAHAHCGLTLPFSDLAKEWETGNISGGVVFSPVEEVYDRHDWRFIDSEEYQKSRRRVHRYLLEIAAAKQVYPFYFVWNDFSSVPEEFVGIKWHRHPNEPVYQYKSPQCDAVIEQICERKLPVVLEEEFANTLDFVMRIAERTVVVIPHMGGLNGGYSRLKNIGVFENPKVWVDTSLSSVREIADFAETYGTDRMMFGSDYPFGIPSREKEKVLQVLSGNDLTAVLSRNLRKLMKNKNTSLNEGTGTSGAAML